MSTITRKISDKKEAEIIVDKRLKKYIKTYSDASNTITKQSIKLDDGTIIPVFSSSNIVGEWAEMLVCKALNCTQEIPSNKDFDVISKKGSKKYQIKSRWFRKYLKDDFKRNGQEEFGSVNKNGKFDKLIIVYFEDDLTVPKRIFEIERKCIAKLNNKKYSLFHKKGNKYAFFYHDDGEDGNKNKMINLAIKDKLLKDITKDFVGKLNK